jgi:hypothetical protein
MKGVKVTDWVSHMLRNIADEVNNDPSLEEDKSLWTNFAEKFELKFTSASALEESRQSFEEYCMKNDDVNEYIAIFEDLLTKIEYKREDFGVIDKFKQGLKKWIVKKILERDTWPANLNEWQEVARREVRRAKYTTVTLGGDRKNYNLSLQEAKWKAALFPETNQRRGYSSSKRNNEVMLMEVDYAATQNPRLKRLTPEERKKLMDEGRCFKCRLKGHQARNCMGRDQTNTSNARVANTPSTKTKETTAMVNKDEPPPYDENQITGLIRAMSTEQREMLLSKIVNLGKEKGKKEEENREPSYQSNDEEGF